MLVLRIGVGVSLVLPTRGERGGGNGKRHNGLLLCGAPGGSPCLCWAVCVCGKQWKFDNCITIHKV
jgi:hypothetical protein